jgi:hypothetical protein
MSPQFFHDALSYPRRGEEPRLQIDVAAGGGVGTRVGLSADPTHAVARPGKVGTSSIPDNPGIRPRKVRDPRCS